MFDLYDIYSRNMDFLWILPAAAAARTWPHRAMAAVFVIVCLVTLRTQVELIDYTNLGMGFLPWFHSPAWARGLVTYSLVILLYCLLIWFSPKTQKIVFFAASLTIFFLAFCASMVIMVV
jgi:hypothetical protein